MRRVLGVLGPGLPFLTFMAVLYGGKWLLGIQIPSHQSTPAGIAFAAVVLAAFLAGTIFHEFGHAAAVRLAGERVLSIQVRGTFAAGRREPARNADASGRAAFSSDNRC